MQRLSSFKTLDEILEEAQTAWFTGDADRFVALFDQIGEFTVPGHQWVGQDNIREAFQEYADAYEVVRIEVTQIIREGERAVVEWRWTDRERGTENLNQSENAIFVETQAGRIFRWREYTDNYPR